MSNTVDKSVVTLQRREYRDVVDGEEIFGEVVYINGEMKRDVNFDDLHTGLVLRGFQVHILRDLEEIDMAVEEEEHDLRGVLQ